MTPADQDDLLAKLDAHGELADCDMSRRAAAEIIKLRAEVVELKAREDRQAGSWNTLANCADTLRARGFGTDHGAVDDRVIAMAKALDEARAELKKAGEEATHYRNEMVKALAGHAAAEQQLTALREAVDESHALLDTTGIAPRNISHDSLVERIRKIATQRQKFAEKNVDLCAERARLREALDNARTQLMAPDHAEVIIECALRVVDAALATPAPASAKEGQP